MKLHHFILLWDEVELSLFLLHFLSPSLPLCCELSNKSKVPLSKGGKKLKENSHFKHPASGMQLKLISQQMLAPSATTKHHCHHLPSGHTRHSNLQFPCFKCQPAVDYAVCSAIKAASQKNLMHFERKGYKVPFLKGSHYHDKEHTILVIKQACCHQIQHSM